MNVQAIMTRSPYFATAHSSLADVARIMADHEVGIVPIVDAEKRVVGILTDRDICKAVATMNRLPSEVSAASVAVKPAATCGVEEDLQSVLRTMRIRHIRRLPAVDKENRLQGILSMDDVILHAEEKGMRTETVTFSDAVRTLKGIYSNRPLPGPSIIRA